MRTIFILIISLHIFNSSMVKAQAHNTRSVCYGENDLSYFPHFQSYSLYNHQFRSRTGLEFTKVIDLLINSCIEKKMEVKLYPSEQLIKSGIGPYGYLSNPWLSVEVDSLGNLSCDFVISHTDRDLEIKLNELFSTCKVNPGLINGKPVCCRFYFVLGEPKPLKKVKK